MNRILHADLVLFVGGLLLGSLLTATFALGWTTAITNRSHHSIKEAP